MLRLPLICSSPPGAQGGQDSLLFQDSPPAPHKSYQEARGSPEIPPAQGRRAGIARATSCHRPSSPYPCAWRRLEAGGKRARSEPVPGSLCAQPRHPSLSSRPRSPVPARRPPRRGAGRARPPRPSGTHSGAAAGPASWGLSGLPAPRPGRSPRLCRASVRPAGSQPSRAGERTTRAGESRAPAAAPGCLAADCPALGKGRAGTAGAGLPGPPPHWASSGGGGAKPSRTVPGSPRAQHARGGKPGWTSARGGETHPAARAGAGAGGLGEPLARLNSSLQDSPLKPGCQLLTHQPKPQKACEPSALSALLNEGGGYLRFLKFSLRSSSPLLRCCRLTGIPPSVSHQKIKLLVAEVIQHSHGLFTPIPKENCNSRPAGGPG